MESAESQKKIAEFFELFPETRYKKREAILRPGDLPQGVYFLKKGFARLYSLSEDGKELSLVLYREGEFFPVVWSFFGKRASIYAFEAITPCTLARAPRDKFLKFMEENPDVFMDITRHIITRFQIALRRMENLTFGNAISQLAAILVIYSKEYGRKTNGEVVLDVPFTHKDLSNLVGVTRETVSIEFKKLERKDLVEKRGRFIVIKNIKKLAKEAGFV